jgi:hypothetical protein
MIYISGYEKSYDKILENRLCILFKDDNWVKENKNETITIFENPLPISSVFATDGYLEFRQCSITNLKENDESDSINKIRNDEIKKQMKEYMKAMKDMKKSPSQKAEGFNKIYNAVVYFRTGRFRELLDDAQNENKYDIDIFEVNRIYETNLLVEITNPNFPSNINYQNNIKLYENLFFSFLESLTLENLEKFFDQSLNFKVVWGHSHLRVIFTNLHDRPHYLLALWNYGLKYNLEDIDYIDDLRIRSIFKNTINDKFINKKRYLLLNNKCPITTELIREPAILTDGYVYEYKKIKKYLRNNNKSPMTNNKLEMDSTDFLKPTVISTKRLYLPLRNSFKYFGDYIIS